MKKFIKISIAFISILIIVLSFSYESILKKIGNYLILDQEPQKSDVIVVLNGRDTERCLAAVDLYDSGYAKLIAIARGSKQPGTDEFRKRVGEKFNNKRFIVRAFEAMGVPENSVKLIGDGVKSTYDEATLAMNYSRDNGYKNILIVTSKWHSKRAYLTFKSVFDKNIELRLCASKYDAFNPDAWWKTEDHIELVLYEYLRFIYYFVTLRIFPFTLTT